MTLTTIPGIPNRVSVRGATMQVVEVRVRDLIGANYRPEDRDHVAKLAAEIAEDGRVLNPIEVASDEKTILGGHHRYAAVCSLGWETIPAYLLDVAPDGPDALVRAMRSNGDRLDVPAQAEAEAFGRLVEQGTAVEVIAAKLHRTVGYVQRRLEILELDPMIRYLADRGLSWVAPLVGLPWGLQREAVRQLESVDLNRAGWSRYVADLRAEADRRAQDPMFFGDFSLNAETWDTAASSYMDNAPPKVQDDDVRADDIAGPREIAERLGVKVDTVAKWRARGLIPEPVAEVSGIYLWSWAEVEKWARETGHDYSS